MKKGTYRQFQDFIALAYPDEHSKKDDDTDTLNRPLTRTVTFQVTDSCNLACSYCYQINKGTRRMSFATAKKAVDYLLSGENGFGDYVNPKNSPGIVIDFIGGEPFLEIDLIDQIVDYFREQVILLDHPWKNRYMFSLCSNGVLYRDEAVQRFLQKNCKTVSLSVTLDGDQKLHDSCRKFPDGRPSFTYALDACTDWMARGYEMGSKITISPENLPYFSQAFQYFVSLGYEIIHANCVFEAEWTEEQAALYYRQLRAMADYLLEDDSRRYVELSIFTFEKGMPMDESDNRNWCGGTGSMLAIDPDGNLYPCIRYMESSVGTDVAPMRIGDLERGLMQWQGHKSCVDCLNVITRKSQSTEECFYCPIAKGCAWCSAWNYQSFGTPDKRSTNICAMHKAESLAYVYYRTRYNEVYGIHEAVDLWTPKQWAVPIVGEPEYILLTELARKTGGYINESDTIVEKKGEENAKRECNDKKS